MIRSRTRYTTAGWALVGAAASAIAVTTHEADIVIYGGTSAGVMAAIQGRRMGCRVLLVCPEQHVGGMTSSGLGWTDTGNKAVIGGLAREFYHRVWLHYQRPEAWKWQRREEYGNRGQGHPAVDGEMRTMWVFEPHVAERIFEDFLREHEVRVVRDEWLDRSNGVERVDGRIVSIRMLSGNVYRGKMFIDATYEGDLMAAAGVSYRVGRESNSEYGEEWNGVQKGVFHHRHYFAKPVDPYVRPGDPSSGLLPRISPVPPGENGTGDRGVQAYCFRMCLTDHPENRVPFPKPEGYDAFQYELLLRVFETGWREVFHKFDPIPNRKTDTNNHGPFSTDNIGMNHDYPEADYARRREIVEEHRRYQMGLMYFMANDPRVPEDVRRAMSRWGLAKDEFVDNGHWPYQLYIREARRMVGEFVLTDQHLLKKRPMPPESVGMGSYTIDSHNVWRYVTPEGTVQNEGDIGVKVDPYIIPYGCIVPKRTECRNLLVPVCVSATHAAYGSVRMEPVYMILGQSAATAAALAIAERCDVQAVPYARLRERLLADGQVLEYSTAASTKRELTGIVVDDDAAQLEGPWQESSALRPFVGRGYRHDGAAQKGRCVATFSARVPEAGRYEVRVHAPPAPNRCAAVSVQIRHAGGVTTATIDQREVPDPAGGIPVGVYEFTPERPALVVISNVDTDGHVVVDAVRWVRMESSPRRDAAQ